MAKFKTSGLIQSIRGKIGNLVCSVWKGVPVVRTIPKKRRRPTTEDEVRVREILIILLKRWKKLSLTEKALWEVQAKNLQNRKNTPSTGGIIRTHRTGVMTGPNAYVKTNGLMMAVGFPISDKPHLEQLLCPILPPKTDLTNYAKFENGKIKFNTQLSQPYPYKCKAQIWIKAIQRNGYPHVAKVLEIDTSPVEVVIEKIRLSKKRQREVLFKNMEKCEVKIQMRTIAQNGQFSMATALYKVEVFP